MENNNEISNTQVSSIQGSVTSSNVDMSDKNDKISKKHLVGIVVMSIIAVGGVLFGIFGMTSQNEKIAELTVRAENAEGKVAELETNKITITDPESGTVEITDSNTNIHNPIIKASGSDVYMVRHTIHTGIKTELGGFASLNFSTEDGKFKECFIANVEDYNCNVNGLPENIYKMETLFEGNGTGSEKIGFLTEDGAVWFAPVFNNGAVLDENIINRQMEAKKAKIDGYVKDIVSVNFGSREFPSGGYASTVFVMSDNSLVQYDESMFE